MANLITPVGTLSFPNLFVPKPKSPAPGAKPVYSCSILFDPEAQKTPEFKALKQGLFDAAKAFHGANIDLKKIMETDWPIRDAVEKDYAGYEKGFVYISPWASGEPGRSPPGIVDGRLQIVIDPSKVYAGAKIRANVSPFGWVFTTRKGVSFGLNHIQLVDTTTPRIDGRVAVDKAFSPLEQLEEEPEDSPI
jgi:hypothetical protein